MTRRVRIPRHVYRQALLNTHYELYQRVVPNDETLFVPGDGDVMSGIVFIGEAPGETEERFGKPFVGKSGNLLSKLLASAGLSRGMVFTTNLVKHRPPGNADPTPEEIPVVSQLMLWELRILEPRIVVPLGRFATSLFWPGGSMRNLHGFAKRKMLEPRRDVMVIPMYHPAAGLRSSSVREMLYDDFQKLKEHLGRKP